MKESVRKGIKIGSFILAGIIAVISIVLIIYGNVTHSETIFIDYCVNGNKVEYFPGNSGIEPIEGALVEQDASCERRNDPLWVKMSFPLPVRSVTSTGEIQPEDHPSWRVVDQAISDTNSQFGFEVFTRASKAQSATVLYRWGVPYTQEKHGRAEGYVRHYYNRNQQAFLEDQRDGDPNGLIAEVGIRDISSDRCAYIITMHEFGHVLFLGHDDYKSSVMFPTSFDDVDSPALTNWTHFSNSDTDAVYNLYAN